MNKKQMNVLRRIENERKKNTMTRHHILNKCCKDTFNVFAQDNTVWINELEHNYHHLYFGNKDPLESLKQINWFMQVMGDQAKEIYQTLINMNDDQFYNKKFLK